MTTLTWLLALAVGCGDGASDCKQSTWYADDDGDGFGAFASSTVACDAPAGAVASSTDCDDTNAAIYPKAAESCDGLDDDCDGEVDEAGATGESTWYPDDDADGYGDADGAVQACSDPGGYVTDATDCDDAVSAANPGATESCDGIDDDCDGVVDEAGATGGREFYSDADGDGWGDAKSAVTACAAADGLVVNGDDCDDTDAAVSPDAEEACNGVDDNCDGRTDDEGAIGEGTYYTDDDGDGFGDPDTQHVSCEAASDDVEDDTDCDDGDAAVNPDAVESCDDQDDDCDGDVDEAGALGESSWYADTDGDGYGTGRASTACDAPSGYVADATDCDDTDVAVYPTAVESCNDVDDDCDGSIDEAGSSGERAWYADGDSDGYGVSTTSTTTCDAPSGYVATATDCDDGDATINPGESESCATAGDDDCDGVANDADAVGCTTLYPDADGDGYGLAPGSCLCDGGSGADIAVDGDCDDGDATVNPDGVEALGDGLDNDCDGATDGFWAADAGAVLEGATPTALGTAGDLDADGYDDVLVGASGTGAGVVYVVRGPATGTVDLASADAVLSGVTSGDYAGAAVALAGDPNQDGYDDLVIGATDANTTGTAYVLYGPVSGAVSLADADASWTGFGRDEELGNSVSWAGDQDGDGVDDLFVGVDARDSSTATNCGGAYVLPGSASGALSVSSAIAGLSGESDRDYAGWAVARAGDVDGDGTDDLLLGAPSDDDAATSAGAAYVLLGPVTGSIALVDADSKLTGVDASGVAGTAVDGAGDMDGDGFDDVLVGAYGAGSGMEGATYLVLGPPMSGSSSLSGADAILYGDADAQSGRSVAGVGDVDGDGVRDVAIGAYGYSGVESSAGAVYVALGPLAGTLDLADTGFLFLGDSASAELGLPTAAAGDVDGDGRADILTGDVDQAYLLLGR